MWHLFHMQLDRLPIGSTRHKVLQTRYNIQSYMILHDPAWIEFEH